MPYAGAGPSTAPNSPRHANVRFRQTVVSGALPDLYIPLPDTTKCTLVWAVSWDPLDDFQVAVRVSVAGNQGSPLDDFVISRDKTPSVFETVFRWAGPYPSAQLLAITQTVSGTLVSTSLNLFIYASFTAF